MKIKIVYEYESACGAKVRHYVIALSDEELTEYMRRLVKAGYEVISAKHI